MSILFDETANKIKGPYDKNENPFLSKIQNRTSEKTGKKILLLYGKISR